MLLSDLLLFFFNYTPVTACPTVCPIAEPTATPPAVAAICPNSPGCWGCGAAWTGAGGGGGG